MAFNLILHPIDFMLDLIFVFKQAAHCSIGTKSCQHNKQKIWGVDMGKLKFIKFGRNMKIVREAEIRITSSCEILSITDHLNNGYQVFWFN